MLMNTNARFIVSRFFLFLDVCKYLIDANPVFTRVHAISEMFSIPHIKIEASRLCATLIKSSQSSGKEGLVF